MIKIREENGSVVTVPAIKGVDGKTAYDYAVDGGYKGSEDDFKDFLNNTTSIMDNHKTDITAHSDIRESLAQLQDDFNNMPVPDVSGQISTHNTDAEAHSDIRELVNDNTIITGTASGTNMILTDSAEASVIDFKTYGRTEQKQYTGKNLLDNVLTTQIIDGITITVNTDKSVTVKGTATADINVLIGSISNLASGEKYIVSGANNGSPTTHNAVVQKILNGTWVANTWIYDNESEYTVDDTYDMLTYRLIIESESTVDTTFYPMIRLASVEDNTYEPYCGGVASPNPNFPHEIKSLGDKYNNLVQGYYLSNNGNIASSNTAIRTGCNIPCKAGDEIKVSYAETVSYIRICYYNNNTFLSCVNVGDVSELIDTAPENATNFNISIISATAIHPETAKKLTVKINDCYIINIKTTGKNLLKTRTLGNSWNGITYTPITNDNGEVEYVSISGTRTSDTYFVLPDNDGTILPDTLEPGKKYIVSANSTHNNIDIRVYEMINGSYVTSVATTTEAEWVPNKDATKTIIRINIGVITPINNERIYPMIRPAGTDNTYEPYKESIATIPLTKPLRSIGDVKDEIVCQNGVYGILRKCYIEQLQSSSNWQYQSINPNVFYNMDKIYENAICTHFNYNDDERIIDNATANTYLADGQFTIRHFSNEKDRTYFKNTNFTTLDEWKNWLDNNTILIQAPLAEPIFEPFEDQSVFGNIVTFDSISYITSLENTEMEVEYYRNNSAGKAISDLDTKILSQVNDLHDISNTVNTLSNALGDAGTALNKVNDHITVTGDDENYGHVKLSDNYKTSDGTASESVGASSKAVADVYAEVNTLKASYRAVGFATGSDKMTLNANTVQKIGSIKIPPKCIATIMLRANNRNDKPDLQFGICDVDTAESSIGWAPIHTGMTQYHSIADTWIHYNSSDQEISIFVFGKASVATNIMYVAVQALCTPIVD